MLVDGKCCHLWNVSSHNYVSTFAHSTQARNNDGLNVKTILKQNIAALKTPSISGKLRTADYLEMCDDAHRCLVLYTRAMYYPTILSHEGERAPPGEDHSPNEDITTALSWSPQAVLRKNGSYSKVCSPLSHWRAFLAVPSPSPLLPFSLLPFPFSPSPLFVFRPLPPISTFSPFSPLSPLSPFSPWLFSTCLSLDFFLCPLYFVWHCISIDSPSS